MRKTLKNIALARYGRKGPSIPLGRASQRWPRRGVRRGRLGEAFGAHKTMGAAMKDAQPSLDRFMNENGDRSSEHLAKTPLAVKTGRHSCLATFAMRNSPVLRPERAASLSRAINCRENRTVSAVKIVTRITAAAATSIV
jgi:hypothetical protein